MEHNSKEKTREEYKRDIKTIKDKKRRRRRATRYMALMLPAGTIAGVANMGPGDKKVKKASVNPSALNEGQRTTAAVTENSEFAKALNNQFITDSQVFKQGFAELPQISFWQQVMGTDANTYVVNVASTRLILDTITVDEYDKMSKAQKKAYKLKLKKEAGVNASESVYMTSGKSHFYDFDKVKEHIPDGIEAFKKEGVDPFYAQSIMLIESPNALQKSNVGAYGAFQLMPSVARQFGLTVNDQVDEREDFDKCAMGAARLLKHQAIPQVKDMLDKHGLEYSENDLYFKLLVLHVYHAGAGNVGKALNAINPTEGGIDLIKKLWKTEVSGFRNASQNYSQVALASHVIFANMNAEKHGVSLDEAIDIAANTKLNLMDFEG
jgi:hypothetical protein